MSESLIPQSPAPAPPPAPASLRLRRIVPVAAGVLLAAAAMLKTYQMLARPDVGTTTAKLGGGALIEAELALATMLLLRLMPRATWGIAIAAFTIFAGVSVGRSLHGVSSCGCFGPINVDPRITAGIDLLMVTLLVLAGPPQPRESSRAPRAALAGMMMLMLLAAAATVYAAVPKAGLVAIESADHDFGTIDGEQAKRCEHVFLVRNASKTPLTITGYESSCGCTVADVPGGAIAAGEVVEVLVRANWTGVTGTPYARVTLNTDNWWTPRVSLVIHAEIK